MVAQAPQNRDQRILPERTDLHNHKEGQVAVETPSPTVAPTAAPTPLDTSGYLVQRDDFIYQQLPGESAPIVIEEFKLIFFAQAKVACTTWKMLFRRMMGHDDWRSVTQGLPHVPSKNGLRYLYNYNLTYANHIMTSSDWTRAMFVRDPKERFLSAYLDKAVEDYLFLDTCCNHKREVYCNSMQAPSLPEFLTAIRDCNDSHWDPQMTRMEAKYWPYINFVGHMHTAQQDAKALLQRLHVWEHFGLTGWGESKLLPIFANEEDGSGGRSHATDAKSKVKEYLYPALEAQVEEFYEQDYESPWFNLSDFRNVKNETLITNATETVVDPPLVEPRDWIYRTSKTEGEASPIVIEKYKLIFFAVPHVAENEFKRLFRRMMGYSDWKTRVYDRKNPDAINEGLVYLRDFNLTRASEMVTDPTWTKAIFVRDPKERFALAYTQTAVRNRALLHQICCLRSQPRQFCLKGTTTRALLDVPTAVEFFEGIATCKSTHWDPITERLGAIERLGINKPQNEGYNPKKHAENKYWQYINFVGNVGDPIEAKRFLEKVGAWQDHGFSGWADSMNDVMGRDSFLTTTSYLKEELRAKKHVQQAIKDPNMEKDLEKFYEQDYKSPLFKLKKKVLFSSQGNTYGKAVNELQPDVKKAQLEKASAAQRQW